MDTTSEFFEWMFNGCVGQQAMLSIWSTDKVSSFCDNIDAAVADAEQRSARGLDTYFGVGLLYPPPAKGRGSADDVVAIGGWWADIDVRHAASHKKQNLPANEDDVRRLLDRVGLPASIEVNSGYGVHAYWLFADPWVFADAADRKEAARQARLWVSTIRAHAHTMGWDVDPVGDLARIMRVPGTRNFKDPANPQMCRIIRPGVGEPARYHRQDLEDLMLAEEFTPEHPRVSVNVGALVLNRNADPPAEKFRAAIENIDQFRKSWERTRRDLHDRSASAYDMSLSTLAAQAGWSDQEIANLLLASRRKHGDDPKLRQDYYQRTIARAKADTASAIAISDLVAATPTGPRGTAEETTGSPQYRQEALGRISDALQVPVAAWRQHGRENAVFHLVLAGGEDIRIGSASDVLNGRVFRHRLYERTGKVVRPMKSAEWGGICEALANIVDVVDDASTSDAGRVLEWLDEYLDQRSIYRDDNWSAALINRDPFIRPADGMFYLHAGALQSYLMNNLQMRFSHDGLLDVLRTLGFVRRKVTSRVDGQVRSKWYWAVAPGEAGQDLRAIIERQGIEDRDHAKS